MYKVFIAEDEIVVREGLRNSIQSGSGPFVLVGEASDGEMALSIMKDVKPDILITDIRMPYLDGIELIQKIRLTHPTTTLVILSGYDEFTYAQQAMRYDVSEYVLKPVSVEDLSAWESIWMRRSSASRTRTGLTRRTSRPFRSSGRSSWYRC
jgi:two-component system response regulator YesN